MGLQNTFTKKHDNFQRQTVLNSVDSRRGASMLSVPIMFNTGAMQLAGEKEEMLQKKSFQLKAAVIQKKTAHEEDEALQKQAATLQLKGLEEEEPLQKQATPFQLKGMEEYEPLQKQSAPFQLKSIEEDEPLQKQPFQLAKISSPAQTNARPNQTGMPDNLKAGVEALSGIAMDDVKVHYNSDKPAQLQALAYAQGTDIHIAPGQEKHLPHEAWHVVQQKQGRVKPTMQMKGGVAVNDDKGLESEADVMGEKAGAHVMAPNDSSVAQKKGLSISSIQPAQRKIFGKADRIAAGGYAAIIKTETWHKEAEAFETRLGSYASNNSTARAAVSKGLKKMQSIFESVYGDNAGKKKTGRPQNLNHLAPFGNDTSEAPTSAGQVGNDTNVLYQIVNDKTVKGSAVPDVNLREKMTAFYNAAYFGKGYGSFDKIRPSLKKIMHEIALGEKGVLAKRFKAKINKKGIMAVAADLGLNDIEIQALQGTMQSKYRRSMNMAIESAEWLGIAKNNFLFGEDAFGVGNLANESPLKLWANLEMPKSHRTKRTRPDTEQAARARTPGEYAALNVPLSVRERNFVNAGRSKKREGKIKDTDKLPWREGVAFFYVDDNTAWYNDVRKAKGFPVVSAISGTTARMLSAYKWLNFSATDLIDFRLAIMGWMLTSRDHSLYEIMRGAEMVGVKGAGEDTSEAVAMYLHIAPLTEDELRAYVCDDRMFPHESAYVKLVQNATSPTQALAQQDKFLLPGQKGKGEKLVNEAEERKNNYGYGKGTDLNLSHTTALMAYTGPDHHVLNAILQWFESGYGADYIKSVSSEAIIADHIYNAFLPKITRRGNIGEYPDILDHLVDTHYAWAAVKIAVTSGAPTSTEITNATMQLRANANSMAPLLKAEAKAHLNILKEALDILPPFNNGKVYMGTWEGYGVHTGKSTSTKSFNYFQSTSKSRSKAMEFAVKHKGNLVKVPVLYEITLKAKDSKGRDIENFSFYTTEQEVLLLVGARLNVQPVKAKENGVNVHDASEI